jgi:hypothetical protein
MKYDLVIELLEKKLRATKQERAYWKRRGNVSVEKEERLIPDLTAAIALLRREQERENEGGEKC